MEYRGRLVASRVAWRGLRCESPQPATFPRQIRGIVRLTQMSRWRQVVFLLVVPPALGCSLGDVVNELRPSFVLEPSTVAPGDSFQAVLKVENPTLRSVTLYGGATCLTVLRVFRGTEPVDLAGTRFFCAGTIRSWTFPARNTVTVVHLMAAAVYPSGDASGEPAPAPPGTYTVRAELTLDLPHMEAELVVWEPN